MRKQVSLTHSSYVDTVKRCNLKNKGTQKEETPLDSKSPGNKVPCRMPVSLHKYNNRAPAITLLSGPTMRVRKEKEACRFGTGTNKSKSSKESQTCR